jgi:hypothetical protein
MPRAPRPWFRFYVETFPDRKIRRLKPAERWVWAAVLGAARESREPGRLMIAGGLPMTVAELADYADVPLRLASKALARMVELGLVVIDGGVITAPKFTQRQYESDNVTARTQKHRERSNDVPTDEVGTFQPSSLERSRNGRRNTQPSRERAPAPPTETETETETEPKPLPITSAEQPEIEVPPMDDEWGIDLVDLLTEPDRGLDAELDEPGVASIDSAPSASKRSRPVDELFDAMTGECGIDPKLLTPSGRGPVNAALKQVREVGATPSEIHRRAHAYRSRYRVPLTPMALAKHWASLGAEETVERFLPGGGWNPAFGELEIY